MPNNRAMRRGCPPPRPPRSTASSGVSRRESLTLLGRGAGVVSLMADIKTLSTPTPPQRQDVVFSGGTHHQVAGGNVELVVTLSQPTVTVVRAKTWV